MGSGEGTTFKVTPALGTRTFNPAFKTITLNGENPVQNAVDFTANSAFTISGIARFAGTIRRDAAQRADEDRDFARLRLGGLRPLSEDDAPGSEHAGSEGEPRGRRRRFWLMF